MKICAYCGVPYSPEYSGYHTCLPRKLSTRTWLSDHWTQEHYRLLKKNNKRNKRARRNML